MPESYKEDARPAQQWYWDDWFSAFDVRLCSLAARGLWFDMLGIMWKAEIRGTLTVNGKQIDSKRDNIGRDNRLVVCADCMMNRCVKVPKNKILDKLPKRLSKQRARNDR